MTLTGARAATVDGMVAQQGVARVQLIKMDVDGHELEVLKGAKMVLERHRPVIVMELAPYVFEPPEKFDRMIEELETARYSFRELGSSKRLPSGAAALRRTIPSEGSINVIAAPIESLS